MGCLWRLLEHGQIRFTSCDDGHKFGLPAPVDAAYEINVRLANAEIVSVEVREGTLDLTLGFRTGHALEIIPDSSGYESWDLCTKSVRFIATGGGKLVTLDESDIRTIDRSS